MSRKAEETDPALVTPEIEALADAVRGDVGAAGVERALAAFREAGDTAKGTVPFVRRRRFDWRPERRRFPTRLSLRAALGVALGGVTLGGVALAAGTGVFPDPLAPARTPGPRPGVHAPRTPDSTGPAGPGRTTSSPAPTPSDRATSNDPASGNRAALCHAWAKGNGKHQGAAFRRLAEAAGGEDAVGAYCAALSGADDAAPSTPGKPSRTPATGSSKDGPPSASPSRGRSAEHIAGAGQRP